MIPEAYIIQWGNRVKWPEAHQVEQDLILNRIIVELFQDARFSHDIDMLISKDDPYFYNIQQHKKTVHKEIIFKLPGESWKGNLKQSVRKNLSLQST